MVTEYPLDVHVEPVKPEMSLEGGAVTMPHVAYEDRRHSPLERALKEHMPPRAAEGCDELVQKKSCPSCIEALLMVTGAVGEAKTDH